MVKTNAVVRDVWVRTDRWPDPKDLRTWATDIFRIEGACTPEARAVALWKWTLISMARGGPACCEGVRGREAYLTDTLKYLAVHGAHYCDGLSRLMINAWEAAGCGRGRKVVIFRLGHTIAELRYRDDDGRTRWHAFDPQQVWYVRSRDGGHIAGIDEIDADPDLLLNPTDPPRPYFLAASRREVYRDREASTRNPAIGASPRPRHRMRIDLRRGERWRRLWSPGPPYWPYIYGPKPKPISHVWVERDALGGGVADGFLGAHVEPYLYPTPKGTWLLHKGDGERRCRLPGTVELRYAVPLAADGFREGAVSANGLASEPRASRASAVVHPTRLGHVGALTYAVRMPYLITDAEIEAVVRTGSQALDMLAMHVSTDGGSSWRQVWGTIFAQTGRPRARPRRIHVAFGQKAYHDGELSVVGTYAYQVRIDVLARRAVGEVGLDALTIRTRGLCNMMALPALLPGANRVTVAGRAAGRDARLRVEYEWTERSRGERRRVKVLPATGGEFTIRAAGRRPADLRMRAVTVEAI